MSVAENIQIDSTDKVACDDAEEIFFESRPARVSPLQRNQNDYSGLSVPEI
jgi:hypothetical protein